MTCEVFRFPDGTSGIVCSRRRRRPKCAVRGCNRPGEYQCDAPVNGIIAATGKRRTCSRYLCSQHRMPDGPGVDYCPEHGHIIRQLKLELTLL